MEALLQTQDEIIEAQHLQITQLTRELDRLKTTLDEYKSENKKLHKFIEDCGLDDVDI